MQYFSFVIGLRAHPREGRRNGFNSPRRVFRRKYDGREELNTGPEVAVRRGENKPMGTAEHVLATGRRPGVLQVVRRIQIDLVVPNGRRVLRIG